MHSPSPSPAAPASGVPPAVSAIRTLFGSPRPYVDSPLANADPARVVDNPRVAIVDDQPLNIKIVQKYAWELELEVAIRCTELAEAHLEVVHCLATLSEYRDNETGKHIVRVGRYAGIIARRLGMDEDFVGRISAAAPLHDIGKAEPAMEALLLRACGSRDACPPPSGTPSPPPCNARR